MDFEINSNQPKEVNPQCQWYLTLIQIRSNPTRPSFKWIWFDWIVIRLNLCWIGLDPIYGFQFSLYHHSLFFMFIVQLLKSSESLVICTCLPLNAYPITCISMQIPPIYFLLQYSHFCELTFKCIRPSLKMNEQNKILDCSKEC